MTLLLALLSGCGTPTTFDVSGDGWTYAVGATARFGPATRAPFKRAMMHAVPAVEDVEMTVADPAVARLENGQLTVLASGSTDIVVSGTVAGRRSTVTATIHAAPVDHLEWRNLAKTVQGDVVMAGLPATWTVRAFDARGRQMLTSGVDLGFSPTFTTRPGPRGVTHVQLKAPESGRVPMVGTPYVIDVVDVWDEVEVGRLHTLTFRHRGRRIHFESNFATQTSLTPDRCGVRPFAAGSNPVMVQFDGAVGDGCRVAVQVGDHVYAYAP